MPRGSHSRKKRQTRRAPARPTASISKTALLEQAGMTDVTALVDASTAPLTLDAPEPAASPERALLEALKATLTAAMSGPCDACEHMAIKHLGADNAGPCTMEGCECGGMVEADDDDGEDLEVDVVAFVPNDELIEAAVAALTESVPGAAPIVRLRLEELRIVHFADGAVALPAEHEPGESLPARSPSPGTPEVVPAPTIGGQLRWRAALVPEGRLTDDGRAMAPGSLTWRELPLSLMAMVETSAMGGHDGALLAGRIDRIWRDADGVLQGEGVFDEGEFGATVGRLVGDGTLRGVSVDIAVHSYEVGPQSDWFDDDGNWAPKAEEDASDVDLVDLPYLSEEPVVMLVTQGVIGAATVCPFQAFADATIELAASLVASAQSDALWTLTQQAGWTVVEEPKVGEAIEGEAVLEAGLTAAAAGLAPIDPPAGWFANPALEELTPFTVTDEGQVFGHAAAWGVCHLGIPDACTTAPHSRTDNSYFHLGEILCDGGERYSIGKITMGTGHADRGLGWREAAAHYDNTGTVVADVISGEDEYGIWVAGALRPNVDAERARELRAATLSGDWRNVNGNLELVALLAVNVPGFPIPRARALVASGEDGSYGLTLVAAGIHNGPVEAGRFVSPEALAKIEALRAAPALSALAARAREAR